MGVRMQTLKKYKCEQAPFLTQMRLQTINICMFWPKSSANYLLLKIIIIVLKKRERSGDEVREWGDAGLEQT